MNYHSIFSLTPGINRCIFLPEVSTEGLTTKDVPALKQKVHRLMEEKLIEYKASWISEQPVQAN
jgi:1-acyl-sn-glycerol-3-phosphate acyltransferase